MDWNHELQASVLWILEVFIATSIGFVAVIAVLVRTTAWGRQFVRIGWPYLSPRRSWKPMATVALLLFLAMFSVRLNVLFTSWYNGFYSALQALDQKTFWLYLGIFSVLAAVHVARSVLAAYVQQAFDIGWREWLNERATTDWLEGDAHYRNRFVSEPGDNPDQRIQLDVTNFVTSSRVLSIGAANAVVSLITFTFVLWSLSGPLVLFDVHIPRAMVFLVYVYGLIATVIAFKLGRPLVSLNFMAERLAANFRYALVRVRENAENIAFYRGEAVERQGLLQRFAAVIANVWALLFRTLKFSGFNLTADQIAVVFPFILQAPRFFSGAIKLGDVMQTSQAFGQVQDSLAFFRTSYDDFAQYRATLNRLTGFFDANREARALPQVHTAGSPQGLAIRGLTVTRPDGEVLMRSLDVSLQGGDSIIVKGPSGAGKTTLLRSLAGLWPYAHGHVERPVGDQSLFLSQRPYLPLGDLRTALAYPGQAAPDAVVSDALQKVQLGHLGAQLDVVADWSQILSIGEQQRLAFARMLINRPRIAFLDEATSATDEGLEHALYTLIKTQLPDCIVVSVGHRNTLDAFHTHKLELAGEGRWTLADLQSKAYCSL